MKVIGFLDQQPMGGTLDGCDLDTNALTLQMIDQLYEIGIAGHDNNGVDLA